MPNRSRSFVVLAHCHLNVNTKVHGLACYEGAREEVVLPRIQAGTGVVQLPCPEATFLGMKRWGMTVEQYDTPAYRRHCRAILGPVVDTIGALIEDGCTLEGVLGVEGSPSCGVTATCEGFTGGEIEEGAPPQRAERAAGAGILVQVLREMLDEAGIGGIRFIGVED
jgi:predicted secreted protein